MLQNLHLFPTSSPTASAGCSTTGPSTGCLFCGGSGVDTADTFNSPCSPPAAGAEPVEAGGVTGVAVERSSHSSSWFAHFFAYMYVFPQRNWHWNLFNSRPAVRVVFPVFFFFTWTPTNLDRSCCAFRFSSTTTLLPAATHVPSGCFGVGYWFRCVHTKHCSC